MVDLKAGTQGGWIALHTDVDAKPGPVKYEVAVPAGVSTNVKILTPTTPDGVALVAAAGVTASGTVTLVAEPSSTAVTLQLQGPPQGAVFATRVTAADGARAIAATCSPTPNGTAVLTDAANIHDTTHAALQVVQGGTALLTLPTTRWQQGETAGHQHCSPASRPPLLTTEDPRLEGSAYSNVYRPSVHWTIWGCLVSPWLPSWRRCSPWWAVQDLCQLGTRWCVGSGFGLFIGFGRPRWCLVQGCTHAPFRRRR